MPTNRETLEWLFATKKIHLERTPIFHVAPTTSSVSLDWDRVEGMLLGLAIGDALGAPAEGLRPSLRGQIFGEIRDYSDDSGSGERKGYPTDDTQLAFWTLEQMLNDDGFVPENVARRFCSGVIVGLGGTVHEFLVRHKDEGRPWHESGPRSAGNGALMRIAPMLVPHLRTRSSDLWVDTALSAMITHNDPASIAACISFIRMLWDLLQLEQPPPPDWWRSTYVKTAAPLEGATTYRQRSGAFSDYEGPIWRFVDERLRDASARRLSVRDACDEWRSSAYLLETIPSALYILTLHGDDPEEAIVRAVNDTVDNDTIGAIVGAAVGALHSRAALPRRWIDGLTGQTNVDDDGRVFELIELARKKWWQEASGSSAEEP